MNDFFGLDEIEQIQESLNEVENVTDFSEETSIVDFDQVTDFSGKEITDFIKDVIPREHLEGCPEIAYNPTDTYFAEHPDVIGFFRTDTHQIEIAGQESFESADDMLDTVIHEIGHNEHANLESIDGQAAERWKEMFVESFERSDGLGFVSEYAKTNEYEDFAESYKTYLRDPELLKFMNPAKYEFMKYNVFEGNEFERVQLDDSKSQVFDKKIADAISQALLETSESDTDESIVATSDFSNPVSDTYRCFSMVA